MSKDIYKTVKEYLKTRDQGWEFIYGTEVFTAQKLIKKMDKDKKFRKMIIEEVVKTATDMLIRST